MNMKAFFPMLLLGSLTLSACNAPKEETKTTTTTTASTAQTETAAAPASGGACMDRIRKDGLRVITSPDYPPYESTNEQNEIVGFDVDMVNAMAQEIGVEAKFTGQGFDGLIPSLISGRADLIAAGLTMTEERAKSVAFSDPYEETKNVIVVSAKDTAIKDAATLNGKKVGVQLGTVQADMAEKIEGADVRTFNLFSEALAALKAGQIDSMIVDAPAGQNYVKANSDIKLAGEMDGGNKALATQLECTDLVAELNAALATLQQNGELDKLRAKWFSEQAQ
ncbi:basic amino acid ABC transporter substrate-binding protein [Deinococcus sp. SL84]|uniref:basic amino acid ABC transporter substrate-binding protein n=1 Tax=Deinococcus sp. SL84 TaxID=2994663 RepID=UPI002275F1CC|nr:basic amino acid ABC transporter substrate-binding protein [Deinococcus sp. SL84]MCY1703258.1 basic amino acid ABC transporter substrate-binding protein [Deinococcus sp. SL84]